MQLLKWAGISVGVIVTAIIVYVCALILWSMRPLPALAVDLPSDIRSATAEFNDRVVTAFPLGSAESGIITELKKQGFKIYKNNKGAELERIRNIACGQRWLIDWKSNAEGKINEIKALTGLVCL